MRLICVALIAACSSPAPTPEPELQPSPPFPAPAPVAPAPLIASPHGNAITTVAMTDEGDAAVTADAGERLRIWPTLDGTHEPVVLTGGAPRHLAIARDGVTLVIAILDTAGNLELVRADRDGRVLGRARPPGEQPYLEVAAIASGMLALRADRAIERFDARGTSRGVLLPDTGSRVLSIATRHGAAIALLDTGDGPSKLRWIAATDQLLWSTTVELPVTLERIALAPGHHRIAGIVRGGANAAIVELAPSVAVIGNVATSDDQPRPFGFVDDDHAVFHLPSTLEWWIAPKPLPSLSPPTDDPWNRVTQAPPAGLPLVAVPDTGSAIGDGLVLAGMETALILVTPTTTHFLGYRELAIGAVTAHGPAITMTTNGHVLWIDGALGVASATATAEQESGIVQVLDAHHVLATRFEATRPAVLEDPLTPPAVNTVLVRDTTTGKELAIGKFPAYTSYGYDPATRVLAINDDPRVARYRLDAELASATKLRPLAARPGSTIVPCTSGAVVAAATSSDDEGNLTFATFSESPGTSALHASTVAVIGTMIGIDPACRLLVGRIVAGRLELWRYTGKVATKLAAIAAPAASLPGGVGGADARGAFDSTGAAVALIAGNEVLVVDLPAGTVRWRFSLWQPHSIVFTGDDREVIVASQGLLALDATTGHRVTMACGWHFGLTLQPSPTAGSFGATTVCEESP